MISIDQEKCIGCGMCVSICDNIFVMDDEIHKAQVKSQEIGECDVQNCIDSCPTQAISNN